MTTIYLATAGRRSKRHQVFGSYDAEDDRYVFAVREFDDPAEAAIYAERLATRHGAEITKTSN